MKKTLALLLFCTGLVACTDYSQERKQVADWLQRVEFDQERLKILHPDSLPMRSIDINSRLDVVADHYEARGETADMEVGLMLADFKVCKKVFKGLSQKRLKLEEQLEISRKQLQNLDQDLKNKAVDKQMLKKYMEDERLAVESLHHNMNALDSLMSRGSRLYIRMQPQIDSLLQVLNRQAAEQ